MRFLGARSKFAPAEDSYNTVHTGISLIVQVGACATYNRHIPRLTHATFVFTQNFFQPTTFHLTSATITRVVASVVPTKIVNSHNSRLADDAGIALKTRVAWVLTETENVPWTLPTEAPQLPDESFCQRS